MMPDSPLPQAWPERIRDLYAARGKLMTHGMRAPPPHCGRKTATTVRLDEA